MIETKDLEKTFEDEGVITPALQGITFNVEKGEFVAIMGPSGSGKSTMLQILGFLDRQTKGTYKFAGREMDDFSEDELAHTRNKKMGFIFQSFNLLPRTSVFENVRLPLIYSNVPESKWKSQTEKAIQAVGLFHRMNHESSQLSGGEKQRVAIARALVNKPEIIFADEPTGNLDTKSGQAIMEILHNMHEKEKITILLITHETYTAEHAERIIKLRDGKIETDSKVANRHGAKDFLK
ncbi:ABC transporter ATP-binding protein [Patescibacteria group bacterium]|nr:ABC transporter ATP-binding protein [Patescibacteria group bacterium]